MSLNDGTPVDEDQLGKEFYGSRESAVADPNPTNKALDPETWPSVDERPQGEVTFETKETESKVIDLNTQTATPVSEPASDPVEDALAGDPEDLASTKTLSADEVEGQPEAVEPSDEDDGASAQAHAGDPVSTDSPVNHITGAAAVASADKPEPNTEGQE